MNTLYHYLGFCFFWGVLLAAACLGAVLMWEAKWFRSTKRRLSNFWLLVRVLCGKRLPMSRRTAAFALRFGGSRKYNWRASWWERDMLAFLIRHARKSGFTE